MAVQREQKATQLVDVFSTNTSYFCDMRKENTIGEDLRRFADVLVQLSNQKSEQSPTK